MPILVQNACFQCRKAFKKPYVDYWYEYRTREFYDCPDCGHKMYYMGEKFKAPAKSNIKEWNRLKKCIENGEAWGIPSERKLKNKKKENRTRE